MNSWGTPTLTKTFKITRIRSDTVEDTQGVVLIINYLILGSDADGHIGIYEDVLKFDRSTVVQSTFIPFNQLTETEVIAWVQASLSEDNLNRIDYLMRSQIQNAKEEALNATVPWLPTNTTIIPKDPVARTQLMEQWAAEAAAKAVT